MTRIPVARRYASALFLLARERGRVEELRSELLRLLGFLEAYPDLRRLLEHRLVPPGAKSEALQRCLGGALAKEVLDFLHVLVRKRREAYIYAIAGEYERLADEARGVVRVEVRSAAALSPALEEGVRRQLERVTGRQVKLQVTLDPELVGGLVVQVGDRVFDSSLRTHLRRLGERLAGAAPVEAAGRGR